jgi:hypothetical protein
MGDVAVDLPTPLQLGESHALNLHELRVCGAQFPSSRSACVR